MIQASRVVRPLLLCPLLLAWLLSAAGTGEDTPDVRASSLGLVTADRVHLRSGPGRSYEILHTFHRGAKVRVLGSQGEWVAVDLPEGMGGYVHVDYVRPAGEGWVAVVGRRVQLRAAPRASASAWMSLEEGARLALMGREGEWVRVRPPASCRGWIHQSYVTVLEGQDAAGEGGSG